MHVLAVKGGSDRNGGLDMNAVACNNKIAPNGATFDTIVSLFDSRSLPFDWVTRAKVFNPKMFEG